MIIYVLFVQYVVHFNHDVDVTLHDYTCTAAPIASGVTTANDFVHD